MFAIIGLGNPGPRYTRTRHNAGFRLVTMLAEQNRSGGGVSWQNKFGSSFCMSEIEGQRCLLILPQKYMNLSGEASVPLLRYYQIESGSLIVCHDDLDLAPGVLRLRRGGSPAGHKGITDIIRHLGVEDFFRVRIGIGHPLRPAGEDGVNRQGRDEQAVTDWVLSAPAGEEQEILCSAERNGVDAVRTLLRDGLETAQRTYNRSPGKPGRPPEQGPGADEG